MSYSRSSTRSRPVSVAALANASGGLATFDDGSTFCAVYVSFAGDGPVKNIVDLALSLPGKVCQGFFLPAKKKRLPRQFRSKELPKQALYSAPLREREQNSLGAAF